MKKRTLPHRNLTGAFVGGVLGILTTHYLRPALLPISCLVGVLIGFWYEEILDHMLDKLIDIIMTTLVYIASFCYEAYVRIGKVWRGTKKVCAFLWKCSIATVKSPVTFTRWLKARPLNKARAIQWSVLLLFWAIAFWCMGPTIGHFTKAWLMSAFKSEHPLREALLNGLQFAVSLTLLFAMILAPTASRRRNGDEDVDLQRYKEIEKIYLQESAFVFFLKTLIGTFVFGGVMLLFLVSGIATLLGVSLSFIFVAAPTMAVFWLALQALNKVIYYNGHWLCAGVTLVVTSITAYMTYGYMSSAAMVWTIALSTGVVSAALTEISRRALAKYFVKNDWVETAINNKASDFVRRAWKYLCSNGGRIGERLFEDSLTWLYMFLTKHVHLIE